MPAVFFATGLLSFTAVSVVEGEVIAHGVSGAAQEDALMQTWSKTLDNTKAGTPVTRVVNLLKEMQNTLKTEMQEDEDLFEKLECWCNTGKGEKTESIAAGEAKIAELTAGNEEGYARSKELRTQIAELETQVADDKQALATAVAKREEELQAFQGYETDSIQALENLKTALTVLSKHHGAAFPQVSLSLLALAGKDEPMAEHAAERSLEGFMQSAGFAGVDSANADHLTQKFLQADAAPAKVIAGWSQDDVGVVKKALKSVTSFAQANHKYYPSYNAQSGEIVGILKQMTEQMQGELTEAQTQESAKAGAFAEMRSAKQAAIEAGEKMSEQKEDELAKLDNGNAEGKEDLAQTETKLAEDKTFLSNLDKMCATADADYEKRRSSRLDEIKAVSETIEILTADEAKDAMKGTYSFFQVSSTDANRKKAADLLREVAKKTHNPAIAFLASSVELDAFTKVKKAIDDMVAALQIQQADEVKKNDYCKSELQTVEMTIMKTNDVKADLEAKVAELESNIITFIDEITAGKAGITQANMELQRASEDRLKANHDFQKTVADQTMTIEVMHKALNRLADFYDKEEFLQQHSHGRQTPPVPQAEYKPNGGAGGVMSMIEKLISEAKELVLASRKSEGEAQTAYETLVADTNTEIDDLAAEVVTKTAGLAQAEKAKIGAQSDLTDTVNELEGLYKYQADVHAECDYVLKNFDARQSARAQEIEALQQAKQILNGANLS